MKQRQAPTALHRMAWYDEANRHRLNAIRAHEDTPEKQRQRQLDAIADAARRRTAS